MAKKSFIGEMTWRGMIQDMTPGLAEKLEEGVVTGYIGFDPTAPSLTIGNYVQVMILTHFQRCGHRPIVLMGGATGRIGDPSGKDAERELKSPEVLDHNLEFQSQQLRRLLDFDNPENGAILVNNLDFYRDMNVLDFLRDVGKNLTINYMLSKESVKRRLDSGMSFTEFSYQLLQAYDFLCLYRKYNCIFQMGGSDQWGNITSGTEFIRRNEPESAVYAMTSPLLTKADGKKFGKSEEGNIWLDPNMTSPYAFYQFWLNADDRDLPKLLRYFSLRDRNEIEALEKEYENDPRRLKVLLAEELTERIHGQGALASAKKMTQVFFDDQLSMEDLGSLSDEELADLRKEAKDNVYVLPRDNTFSCNAVDFLVDLKLCPSKSEARRIIQQQAAKVNLERIGSIEDNITADQFILGKYLFVQTGKKNKRLVVFE